MEEEKMKKLLDLDAGALIDTKGKRWKGISQLFVLWITTILSSSL